MPQSLQSPLISQNSPVKTPIGTIHSLVTTKNNQSTTQTFPRTWLEGCVMPPLKVKPNRKYGRKTSYQAPDTAPDAPLDLKSDPKPDPEPNPTPKLPSSPILKPSHRRTPKPPIALHLSLDYIKLNRASWCPLPSWDLNRKLSRENQLDLKMTRLSPNPIRIHTWTSNCLATLPSFNKAPGVTQAKMTLMNVMNPHTWRYISVFPYISLIDQCRLQALRGTC